MNFGSVTAGILFTVLRRPANQVYVKLKRFYPVPHSSQPPVNAVLLGDGGACTFDASAQVVILDPALSLSLRKEASTPT